MLNSLFRKSLRDQLPTLAAGAAGLLALSLFLNYLYPFIGRAKEILRLVEQMPPFIRDLVDPTLFSSAAGFFNLQPFSILAPLIFIALAVARGCDLTAGEEERGTIDLLLSCPLSRPRLLLAKLAATVLVLALLALSLFLGMAAAGELFSVRVDRGRLLQAAFSLFLLSLVFLTLAAAAGALAGRKRPAAFGVSALALAAYLIQGYAHLAGPLRPLQKFSPFYYYNGRPVLLQGLDWSRAAVLAGLALLFAMAALFFFQRRDLRT